jgi:DNA-binding response OmpR family regulator
VPEASQVGTLEADEETQEEQHMWTSPVAEPTQLSPQFDRQADRPVALVVDDDLDTLNFIAALLERDGWSVRKAHTGEQALLMAREHVPEIIVLDLALPIMSGLDVLRTLKSWSDQRTRVVVVSAFAMLMRLPDLRLADATVQKPIDAKELVARVNRTAGRQAPSPTNALKYWTTAQPAASERPHVSLRWVR